MLQQLDWHLMFPEPSTSQTSNAHLIHQEQKTSEPAKRKIQKSFQPKKAMKLADIATNIIDNQNKNINEDTDNQVNDNKLSENDSDIVQQLYNMMN